MKPLIFTITGPSCAGKSTLESQLKVAGFVPAISTTTRKPRPADKDGVNYHFVDPIVFDSMLEEGQFVERVEFDGNRYGLTAQEVQRIAASGRPVVAVVEPNGRDQIKAYCKAHGWDCVSVYVGNPPELIAERFLNRFIEELRRTPTDHFDATLKRNANRLATMMTTEGKWVNETSWSITPYDMLWFDFNEMNAPGVVTSIIVKAVEFGYFQPTLKKMEEVRTAA